MRKQGLIHIHGLLSETAEYLEEEHDLDIDYDRYDAMDVQPTSIHKSKDDHKRAIYTLSDAITDAIDDTYDTSIERPDNGVSFDDVNRELGDSD